MQATLDSVGLKHWTRALTCLSKFGEDLTIIATPETFALSATNQSLSAYGRFKYAKSFFSRYRVGSHGAGAGEDIEVPPITGQIVIKPLLQILKHKTIEKSCEKCEFVISHGASQEHRLEDDNEDEDTLESRLTVRLHCKHGVVKTHRLPLNAANNLMSPTMPDAALESHVTIGPKAVRNMLEHFPFGKGSKTDPQLIWNFRDSEVQLRSLESAVDAKGRAHLMTELTISADEFDEYELQDTPMTIAFHLREFNATIAFAEASQLPLEIRFTDPHAPLYIDVGGDIADTLFVIAASQLQSISPHNSQARQNSAGAQVKGKKRALEDDDQDGHARVAEQERARGTHVKRPAKPMKVVHRADHASIAREMHVEPPAHEPQPSWAVLTATQRQFQEPFDGQGALPSQPSYGDARDLSQRVASAGKEPLFLPGSQLSQLPPAAEAAIIESGLGIEHMTAEEFEEMLEGDAEEVEFGTQRSHLPSGTEDGSADNADAVRGEEQDWQIDEDMDFMNVGYGQRRDSFELIDDVEMEPTQNKVGMKVFRPLFED
ncbi:Rad9-domain-containing protein [Trametes punicea]|nr:Rad9-domain-containing protein [Trametes punicea]